MGRLPKSLSNKVTSYQLQNFCLIEAVLTCTHNLCFEQKKNTSEIFSRTLSLQLLKIAVSLCNVSARALTQVLQHYFSWNNVALIYDKQTPYESLASALREYADDASLTIKSSHYIQSETKEEDIRSILMQMKKYTRGWYKRSAKNPAVPMHHDIMSV